MNGAFGRFRMSDRSLTFQTYSLTTATLQGPRSSLDHESHIRGRTYDFQISRQAALNSVPGFTANYIIMRRIN